MKGALRLAVLVLLYLLFSAGSCSRQDDLDDLTGNNSAENARDSLVSVFTADKLSKYDLAAFEEKAVQQFRDYLDFAAIAADSSLAIEFREQADKMARDLFLPHDSIIMGTGYLTSFPVDSIWIATPLKVVDHTHYQGELGFSPRPHIASTSRATGPGAMDFYLVRQSRVFGTDTLNVWTVLLGRIR